MKIAVRLDDITESMDWPKFLRFKGLLDYFGIKPLLGVIPDCRDLDITGSKEGAPEDFWEYVRNLQNEGYAIAMHGVNHVYVTKKGGIFGLNRFSEFAGLSYDEQYESLSYGVDIFNAHDLNTDMFMAPAHSYDMKTLNALKELGFTRITDGFGKMPYIYKDLTFYPISFWQGGALKHNGSGYCTFTIHTNTLNEADFERYENMFRNYRDRFISYSDYLNVTPVNRSFAGALAERALAGIKSMLSTVRQSIRRS